MPPSESDYRNFRADVGDTNEAFDDTEIDDIWVQCEARYSTAACIYGYAVVIGIKRLIAQAAKEVSYTEGSASMSLSDRVRNLKILLGVKQEELDELVRESNSSTVAMWGGMRRVPSRSKEYPDY